MIRRNGKKQVRRAAAAVEMAVVTPLLLTLTFGIIEFGWMFAVRNTMINAAREGARTLALQGRTADDVDGIVMEYMTPLGLADTVTVEALEPTEDDPTVSVTLTVPRSAASLVGDFFGFANSGNITATAFMRREGM